jgi:hypothetical protein
MDWNTILIKFIDGPGLGFTAMVLGFFGLIAILTAIKATNRRQEAFREGQETRRAGDLELLKSQLARVVDDQNKITTRIESRPARPPRRRNAVLEAEVAK